MSIYEHYKQCIAENLLLPPEDMFFKSDPRYNYVLEHVDFAQGYQYIGLAKEEFKELFENNKELIIDTCWKNDTFGKTKKYNFKGFFECSPTNLRYIYQSLLILDYIKNLEMTNVNIVEIGGGYGGLCLFLHKLSCLFDVDINSYIIYDLKEAEELQKKYLKTHEIILKDKSEILENSFLVSNYAFSELPQGIRLAYENYVIKPFCGYGFLAWNGCELYEFIDNKQITHTEERPITHPDNKYVYFKPNK